jgi:AcrR family transcriptional regulator
VTDWDYFMAETKRDPRLKEDILISAMELMSQKGVIGTTLSDIATDCNISRGTLYYYYRSKNDLILDINEWNMEKLTSRLLKLLDPYIEEGRDFSQIMLEVFKTISGAGTRGRMHLYLINEAISRNPELVDKLRDSYSKWFSILETAFEKILPDRIDREAVARAVVASIDGLMIQNILSIDKVPLDRVVESMVSGYGV